MATPIVNWVVLVPGVQVRLHFKDHRIVKRTITDPVRGVAAERESLVFYVDRKDGSPVDLTFSVMSQKLAGELSGYLEGKRYLSYEFVIVKDAPGFVAPRIVSVTPI